MAYTTIDDPSAHFQTTLYTGNGGTLAVTNSGNSDLQPDWVWIKSRPDARDHQIYDSVRGVTKVIGSDRSSAEATVSNGLTAFGSDGFTVGSDANVNDNGDSHVAWNWKAGGSASSNSSGSITSSVSANTTAGFSIVSWTGNGSNGATIGHGLGATPAIIFTKRRDDTGDWLVGGSAVDTARGGANSLLLLNTDVAMDSNSEVYQTFSSTTFQVGVNAYTNTNNATMISYCFAEKQGYSKFGIYAGNGNVDGTFVYTGFKPAFVIVKSYSEQANWQLADHKRTSSGGNVIDKEVRPDVSNAETGGTDGRYIDFYSNGFKPRQAFGNWNASGSTYLYIALAENPFVTSTGIPTTAR